MGWGLLVCRSRTDEDELVRLLPEQSNVPFDILFREGNSIDNAVPVTPLENCITVGRAIDISPNHPCPRDIDVPRSAREQMQIDAPFNACETH
jgi:hypothetical protein